jgi:hypothetical protein
MKNFLIIFILFFICHPSLADSISDATFLRKASLHIRGSSPSPEEYNELKATPLHARKNFLKTKIKNYLKTSAHQERMRFRLAELFRLKTPGGDQFIDSSGQLDSLSVLFTQIAKDNLSWDTLLTGKSYVIPSPSFMTTSPQLTDLGFFKLVYETLPETHEGVVSGPILKPAFERTADQPALEIKFSPGDPRIAGALTTKRFLSRYSTTAINKNRRRAAAVFRIFLCDPMIPAIESGKNRKHEFVNSTFAENFEVTDEMIAEQLTSNQRHGTDPQCMSCHSKLDPLGRTFQGSGLVLHPETFSGRLFYKRSNKETVDLPAAGIGEIASHITQQKEYVDCQVKWFWDQFIGVNIPLSPQRASELANDFNRVQRKTNDFIEVLLSAKEFRERPQSKQGVVFSQVSGLLKRCDACHTYEGAIPVFSQLPIGFTGKVDEQTNWLLKMKQRMELPIGHKDQMPKDRSKTWTEADIQLLLTWLNTGAKDDNQNSLLGGTK